MLPLFRSATRHLTANRKPWLRLLWPLFLGTAVVDYLTERLLDVDNPLSMGGDLTRLVRFAALYLTSLLLALVVTNFSCIIMYQGYNLLERGEKLNTRTVYRQAMRYFHRMFLLNVWIYVRTILGLVLLILPGFYLFFSFQFANFTLLDGSGSNRQAMAKSSAYFSVQPGKLTLYFLGGILVYGVFWLASHVAGELSLAFFPREAAWCVSEAIVLAGATWVWVFRIAVYKEKVLGLGSGAG